MDDGTGDRLPLRINTGDIFARRRYPKDTRHRHLSFFHSAFSGISTSTSIDIDLQRSFFHLAKIYSFLLTGVLYFLFFGV